MVYVIEDEAHAEQFGQFPSLVKALGELRRLSSIAWDQPPNVAPCTHWKTCGRRYELIIYDTSSQPWKVASKTPMFEISAKGVQWSTESSNA
jgi:hypothetical protein